MVERNANTKQDSVSSDSQPVSTRKPRRSNKAPAVKAAVLVKRSQGVTKSQIARDLAITRPTVNAIIEESDLDRQLSSGTLMCSTLIPKAIGVVDERLNKGSETAAFRLLEGIGVLGNQKQARSSGMMGDAHLQIAIQNLIQPSQAAIAPAVNHEQDCNNSNNNELAGSSTNT